MKSRVSDSVLRTHERQANAFVQTTKVRRCISMPHALIEHRGILKLRTLDESLHSTYGSESGAKRNIKFHEIQIREYGRTVGDNPSCSAGPPVSISWAYNVVEPVTLDEYEETRPPRRSHMEMVLPRKVRHQMLKSEWDVTQREIAEAVRNNIKAKNQRKATVNNLGKATQLEEKMEKASKKLKNILLFKKSTKKQVADLEKKMDEAERRRSQLRLQTMMAPEYASDEDKQTNGIDQTASSTGGSS